MVTEEVRPSNAIVKKMPSELKTIDLTPVAIEKMEMREVATVWAAFYVRYNDVSLDIFSSFRDRIFRVMEENDLDESFLVNRNDVLLTVLVNIVLDCLQREGSRNLQ